MARFGRWRILAAMTAALVVWPLPPANAIGLAGADIAANLQAQIDAEPTAQYRITVRELGGDARQLDIGAHDALEPASSIKAFYAWLVLRRVDEGSLRLADPLAHGLTWGSCLRLMIVVSDNLCSADIRESLGNVWVNRQLADAGFADTRVLTHSGVYIGKRSSTADLAELFVRLESGTLLSPDSTTAFHNLLRAQVWRTRVTAGVPAGVRVEDKPGILAIDSGMVNTDVAIVRATTATYVIAVIGDHDATREGIARLSRTVYEGLTGELGYVGAAFPSEQFIVRKGAALARSFGGPTIATLDRARRAHLTYTERDRAFVTVDGIGKRWVSWSKLRLAASYRWRG